MTATLILLHGFTNTGASWDPVVAALGERYRALAPDIRGHGAAAARRPVSLEAVIADLDALSPGRLELAGYSMGGRIALHLALARPGRVDRLVLIGASPGLDDAAQRTARRQADGHLADQIEATTIEAFATRWATTPVLAGSPPAVAARAHADRLRNTPDGLAAALRGLGTGALPSLWGRLGEVALPVELVVGARDEKFGAIAAEMAARLPQARVHVIPEAGHAVHLEQPEAVAAVIGAAPRSSPQAPAARGR